MSSEIVRGACWTRKKDGGRFTIVDLNDAYGEWVQLKPLQGRKQKTWIMRHNLLKRYEPAADEGVLHDGE